MRDYGTILLIGGGSGITHVGSVLYDIVEKIKAGTCTATQVRLVWAVQQLGASLYPPLSHPPDASLPAEQTEWLQGALQSIRDSTSSLPHLDLKLDIYVTRHELPSGSSSQESLDEKKGMTLPCPPGLGGATIHLQRPEIAEMMHTLMGETHDNILVVGESFFISYWETSTDGTSSLRTSWVGRCSEDDGQGRGGREVAHRHSLFPDLNTHSRRRE